MHGKKCATAQVLGPLGQSIVHYTVRDSASPHPQAVQLHASSPHATRPRPHQTKPGGSPLLTAWKK